MECPDNQILIYVGDKPIACTTGATLNIDDRQSLTLCDAVPEWDLTVTGKWPDWTRLQALEFEWYAARRMPRKKKKSYRQKLEKAIAYERYREQVDEFLSTIGPEMQ